MTKKANVHAGKFYTRDRSGRLTEVSANRADVWICRRLVDFPTGPPDGSEIDTCRECSAPIVYDPARDGTPKICMQCAGIQPLPIE